MSIVTPGILRCLYNDAMTDIEYKSSEFWQHYLKSEFSDIGTYTVTCEVSPDGSRRRVDIVVKRFDQSRNAMTALLWVECKRPGGSIAEVEEQVLDAAKRYIKAENNLFIYTMTTVGVAFRCWFYEADKKELIPFHGERKRGDRSQYINADSEHAWVLPQCMELVKQEIPLKKAPVLLSQSLSDLQNYSAEQGDDGHLPDAGESSPSAQQHQQSWQPADDEGGAGQSLSDFQYNYGAEQGNQDGYLPDAGESSSSAQQHQQLWQPADNEDGAEAGQIGRLKVNVRREEHTFRPDQYIFKDAKGHTRKTLKKDWQHVKLDGEKLWLYSGKKIMYVSDIEIK